LVIRHPKKTDKKSDTVTEAPLDYSGEASGLFTDEKQKQTSNV